MLDEVKKTIPEVEKDGYVSIYQCAIKQRKKKRIVIPTVLSFSFVSVILIVITILSIGKFEPNYSKAMIVKNRVQDAQYLPNVELLSQKAKVRNVDYSNALEFNLNDYNEIVDELAIITGTAAGDENDIYGLKKEIYSVLDLVPVFGEWFQLPHANYLSSSTKQYGNYYYKFDYNSNTESINVTRMTWRVVCSAYIAEDNKIYSTRTDDEIYQHQLMQLNYYFNEDGKEVVECSVVDYLILDKIVYPIQCQYLMNIENTSTTKIQIVLRKELDIYEKYIDIYQGNFAIDLAGYNESGSLRKIIQLNYADSKNIELLKIEQNSNTEYLSDIKTTNLAYYSKEDNYITYFTDAWDYYDKASVNKLELKNIFSFNEHHITKEEIISNLTKSQYSARQVLDTGKGSRSVCTNCFKGFYNSNLLVYKCNHNKNQDTISRNDRKIICSNDEKYDEAMQLIPWKISNHLSVFGNTLGANKELVASTSANICVGMNDTYQFEANIDSFTNEVAKDYVKNVSLVKDAQNLHKTILRESRKLEQKDLNKSAISSMIDFVTFTEKTEIDNNIITVNATGTIKSSILLEKDARYSIGLILYDDNNNASYVLLSNYVKYDGSDLNLSLYGTYNLYDFIVNNKHINITRELNLTLGYALIKDSELVEPICSNYQDCIILTNPNIDYKNIVNGFECTYKTMLENNTLLMNITFKDVQNPNLEIDSLEDNTLTLNYDATLYDLLRNINISDNDMISSFKIYNNDIEYKDLFETIKPGLHKIVVTDRSGNETVCEFNIVLLN